MKKRGNRTHRPHHGDRFSSRGTLGRELVFARREAFNRRRKDPTPRSTPIIRALQGRGQRGRS
jgi:hypothetical protein